MFGSFAFAQAYFAGVVAILRRAAAAAHGGSGFPPDWEERMLRQQAESERLRRERERELALELEALIATGLL